MRARVCGVITYAILNMLSVPVGFCTTCYKLSYLGRGTSFGKMPVSDCLGKSLVPFLD